MKKLLLTLLVAIYGITLCATPLSPQQALQRVQNAGSSAKTFTGQPSLVYSGVETSQPSYYVFDTGEGYFIASADDLAEPLLGYVSEGSFDYSAIPEQMRWWLGESARQIDAARNSRSTRHIVYAARPEREPIPPLVATRWNQSAPFNDLCPEYNGVRAVTGCVATAMAQICRYWQYPLQGKGSHSYYHNGILNSFNFGSTTFDWENMALTYSTANSDAENLAVATLMRACGVAVDMMYETAADGGSGAYSRDVPGALIRYMCYAPTAVFHSRDYFGLYEWENKIYDELRSGAPVYYAGRGTAGGHAFVVDGYEGNGFFHLNWGWGGSSDGYFLLTALNPTSLGIGGGGGGFNQGQGAILGLRPDFEGAKAPHVLAYTYGFEIDLTGSKINLYGFGENVGTTVIPGVRYCFRLTNIADSTKVYTCEGSYVSNLKPNYGLNSNSAVMSERPENGTYIIEPYFKVTDNGAETDYKALIPPSCIGKYRLVAEDSGMTISALADVDPIVTYFAINSPLFAGGNFSFSATYANNSATEFYEPIYMGWFDAQKRFVGVGDAMITNLVPGQTEEIDMSVAVPDKVDIDSYTSRKLQLNTPYKVALVRQTGYDYYNPSFTVLTPYQDVTIKNRQEEFDVQLIDFQIENAQEVCSSDIRFSASVKSPEGSRFTAPILFFVRDNDVTQLRGATTTLMVAPGETKTVNWRFAYDAGEIGKTYQLLLNCQPVSTLKYLGITDFTIATSGVPTATSQDADFSVSRDGGQLRIAAPESICDIDLFSLQGVRQNAAATVDGNNATVQWSTLDKGVYLVRIITTSQCHTLRIAK